MRKIDNEQYTPRSEIKVSFKNLLSLVCFTWLKLSEICALNFREN